MTLPFAAGLLGIVGTLAGLHLPVAAIHVLLALGPIAWCLTLPRVRLHDRGCVAYVGLAIALQLWMAVVMIVQSEALPVGWWRWLLRAAAFGWGLAVLVSPLPSRAQLALLGAAAACAALVCGTVNWTMGLLRTMETRSIGFGHVNAFVNIVGPPLLAWGVFLLSELLAGRRPRARDAVLCAAGLAALVVVAALTARRGTLVAAAAVAAWFALAALWRRSRALALLVAAAGVAALTVKLAPKLVDHAALELRDERIVMYKAMLETAWAGLPFGHGHYGALHAQWLGTGMAALFTASESYSLHAHNEFIDVLLDGGPLALALFVGLWALAAWRSLRIADTSLARACQALLVAMTVHLMTDNFYGTSVGEALFWMFLAFVVRSAPPVAAGPRLRAVAPPPHLITWALVAIGVVAAWFGLPMATIHREATPAVQLRVLERTIEPLEIGYITHSVASAGFAQSEPMLVERALGPATRRAGMTGAVPMLHAELARMRKDWPTAVGAYVAVLRQQPCDAGAYTKLAECIAARPDLVAQLPPEVERRLRLMRGDALRADPDLSAPAADISDAADLAAALRWAIVQGRPWSTISPGLRTLTTRFGRVPDIAHLVLEVVATAPPGSFPWFPEHCRALLPGWNYLRDHQQLVASWANPRTASTMLPFVRVVFAEFVAECENRRLSGEEFSDSTQAIRLDVFRIWGWATRGTPAR